MEDSSARPLYKLTDSIALHLVQALPGTVLIGRDSKAGLALKLPPCVSQIKA